MPNGSNFILGKTNTATLPTVLNGSVPKQPFTGQFRVATSSGGTGIMGTVRGRQAIGVVGDALGARSTGVFGQAEGIGVFGLAIRNNMSPIGTGVFGWGVTGVSAEGDQIGVDSHSNDRDGIAVRAIAATAGAFFGTVVVNGALLVTGPKAAAVRHPDGSHRTLYSLESPESWFEDFGRARLEAGRARVELDRDFAALVRLGDYHVFITPEGECETLYVRKRTRTGFEVRERARGRSHAEFSYRIVAKRKDVTGARLAKASLPTAPEPRSRSTRSRQGARKARA